MGLILFLFCFIFFRAFATNTTEQCPSKIEQSGHLVEKGGIHFTLYPAHGPCSPLSTTPLSPAQILKQDEARVRALRNRRATFAAAAAENLTNADYISIPLTESKASYVIRVNLGTPAKAYLFIVDTGSGLNWLRCRPNQVGSPTFDPSASKTYRRIQCRTKECDALEEAASERGKCSPINICLYQVAYLDLSSSSGELSLDTMTVVGSSYARRRSTTVIKNFIFGCSLLTKGDHGKATGIMGLDRSQLSLISQLSSRYGNAFAYCLPRSSSTGSLSIGRGSYDPSRFRFTPLSSPLSLPSNERTFYVLRLNSVKVAGENAVKDRIHLVIDSGTHITRLEHAVYKQLRNSFIRAMKRYKPASAIDSFDTCYKGRPKKLSAPMVQLEFEGGATLDLGVEQVLFEVQPGQSCLAFIPDGFSILGSYHQLTYTVAYDVENSRIGFARGGCS